MKMKESFGEKCFIVFNVLFMMFLVIIMFYPMMYVLLASLSDSVLFQMHDGLLIKPLGFNLESYIRVFQNPMILSGYGNTFFVLIVGTFSSMFFTILTAYVLSRKNFPASKFFIVIIIITMYFGGGLIPFYITVKAIGLNNSLWALVLPNLLNTYNLIIMRTSFSLIPQSLEESAKLDGAGHLTVLFKIIIPMSSATIAVIILYYAVSYWNSWFNAMVFIRDRTKYPLQLILQEILIQNDTSNMTTALQDTSRNSVAETIKYATIIVATVPILAAYPFAQKYFVKGVMVGAVKE